MDRILLVPGFFGFSTLGEMRYFHHVRRELEELLLAHGVRATLHDVPTRPTASVERRAELLALLADEIAGPDDRLHIIGHSTGGLDARMLAAVESEVPGAEALLPRIRTIITVASPHRGTPIARFFQRARGERILRLLSLMALHIVRLDRPASGVTAALVEAVGRSGAELGLEPGLVDQLCRDVLSDFHPERRQELQAFLTEVWADRSLLRQLTPEGMAALGPKLVVADTVRCGSVVTRAVRPTRSLEGLRPSQQLFRMLYKLTGHDDVGRKGEGLAAAVARLAGQGPAEPNDAIVPSSSQGFGVPLHGCAADHLDVLGYFDSPDGHPRHVDWLRSGSGFQRGDFRRLWNDVAAFVAMT